MPKILGNKIKTESSPSNCFSMINGAQFIQQRNLIKVAFFNWFLRLLASSVASDLGCG